MRGLLSNVQCERDGFRNESPAARESTPQVVRNEGADRAREAEAVAVRDNASTVLTQVGEFLTHFWEWISLGMLALLKIFNSIVGQGNGTPLANPRL